MSGEGSAEPVRFAAVVLAGGRGSRLGGVDKAGVEVGGRTLLDLALDAVVDAVEVVVVGEAVPTERPVTFTREDPLFGGPAAGLCAGVGALIPTGAASALTARPGWLVVTAVDLPRLTPSGVRRLLSAGVAARAEGVAGGGHDGAVLVAEGRRQPVLAVLRDRFDVVRPGPEEAHGMSWRALLERLDLVEVDAVDGEERDVDTHLDLLEAREAAARPSSH